MKTLQDDQDATSVGTMCIQLCTRMREDINEAKKQTAISVADNAIVFGDHPSKLQNCSTYIVMLPAIEHAYLCS